MLGRASKGGHLLSSLHPACNWEVESQDAMGRKGGFEGRP